MLRATLPAAHTARHLEKQLALAKDFLLPQLFAELQLVRHVPRNHCITLPPQRYRDTILHDLEAMVFSHGLEPRAMTKQFACVIYDV